MNEIEVRDGIDSDRAFVIATWLHYFKGFSYFAKRIKPAVYYRNHNLVINRILSRPETRVFIGHPVGEPDVILAFLVVENRDGEKPIIHFAFVKEELRKNGIARILFERSRTVLSGAQFTHWTLDMNDIHRKFSDLIYNPYAV